jgi:hypothetical protein
MSMWFLRRRGVSSFQRPLAFLSVLSCLVVLLCKPALGADDIGAILAQIKAEGVAGFETAAAEPVEETGEASESSLDDLDAFFESYLRSHASNNPWDVASHYADGAYSCYAKAPSGRTTRAEIADAARKFIASFPHRSYSDVTVSQTMPMGPNAVRINYSFNYQYNGIKPAAGRSDVWITVERREDSWKITSFDETVTRLR